MHVVEGLADDIRKFFIFSGKSNPFMTSSQSRLRGLIAVNPYMIVCLFDVLRRRFQSKTGAGDSGASSFDLHQ